MATIRKLSTFRQLSLNCEERRKSLKKQFSEEKRPPIKIAWADPASPKDAGVIAKKCIKEAKKSPKLTKHSSLEKESILYSKQELAERLRQALKEREQEKPNLNIFLAHNTVAADEDSFEPEPEVARSAPKIMPPLLTPMENVFQIRKSKDFTKSSAIVVIPFVEKEDSETVEIPTPPSSERGVEKDPKAIKNVIIRPATASSKRERFQKRQNTAFTSVIKEGNSRPPLVRSNSAPTKPEPAKPKFLATKRKIKSGKRSSKQNSEDEDSLSNKENPKSKKEMNRYVPVNGSDIVTMVSLISPAASDNEEIEEVKPKAKNSPVKTAKKEEKEVVKNLSLRKTVKSVSFQQSSIHAIRSFSASFPARRGSMATALMLGNGLKSQKNQEKRGTNSTVPDDDERGPKRRLVRSATDKTRRSSDDDNVKAEECSEEEKEPISIDIKTKTSENDADKKFPEPDKSDNLEVGEPDAEKPESGDSTEPQFGSVKEKECWDMYCKMADKGLKVSYDTILRGMLTPTEYRMRRKESIANAGEETTSSVATAQQ